MQKKFLILWLVVMFTLVPYAGWHLLFYAPIEQYALLIAFILFWFFGYWSIVMPVIMIMKIRSLYKKFEDEKDLKSLLLNPDSHDIMKGIISSEIKLPRSIINKIYPLVVRKITDRIKDDQGTLNTVK